MWRCKGGYFGSERILEEGRGWILSMMICLCEDGGEREVGGSSRLVPTLP